MVNERPAQVDREYFANPASCGSFTRYLPASTGNSIRLRARYAMAARRAAQGAGFKSARPAPACPRWLGWWGSPRMMESVSRLGRFSAAPKPRYPGRRRQCALFASVLAFSARHEAGPRTQIERAECAIKRAASTANTVGNNPLGDVMDFASAVAHSRVNRPPPRLFPMGSARWRCSIAAYDDRRVVLSPFANRWRGDAALSLLASWARKCVFREGVRRIRK